MSLDNVSVPEHIGATIAQHRTRRLMTQADFGHAMGEALGREPWVTQTVSAAERGKRAFTAVELVAMCQVLEVGIQNLFEGIDLPSDSPRPAITPKVRASLSSIRAQLEAIEAMG